MNITRDTMERAVAYLAETDEPFARAKALYEGLCEQKKIIKANNYQQSRETTASAREHAAYNSMEYRRHLDKIQDANVDYLLLQARRATQVTVIDCWRSLNAARNKGQIV